MVMALKYIGSIGLILILPLIFGGCASSSGEGTRGKVQSVEVQSRAKINLGNALLLQGEYTKALVELLAAREMIGDNNDDLENFLGLTYYGMKEYELATESYLKTLELNPKRTDTRNNLGLVYVAQKNYQKALVEFQLCQEDLVYERKYMSLSNMGLTYILMGKPDEALAILTKATEVAPDYAKSYQLMGRIFFAQGKTREAADFFLNAVRLNPDDPESQMLLGDTQALMNMPEDAATSYSQVMTLVPNTPLALEAQKRARRAMGFD